jgi:hypothetical protein
MKNRPNVQNLTAALSVNWKTKRYNSCSRRNGVEQAVFVNFPYISGLLQALPSQRREHTLRATCGEAIQKNFYPFVCKSKFLCTFVCFLFKIFEKITILVLFLYILSLSLCVFYIEERTWGTSMIL